MDVLTIVALIFIGIVLLLLEFLVLPGVTVFGIAGIGVIGTGIYYAYEYFGQDGGLTTLVGSFIAVGLVFYYAFKSKTWDKAMLKTGIVGKVDSIAPEKVKPGDEGVSIGRLAPIGKVKVNGNYYEGKSIDIMIDSNTKIIVVKVLSTQLIVKPKND
jgi:membrane-bound ClpP family serine protease